MAFQPDRPDLVAVACRLFDLRLGVGIIGNVGFPNTLEAARRSTLETAPSKTPKQDRFLILLARMQLLCRIRSGRQ